MAAVAQMANLLAADEETPAEVFNRTGRSPVCLVCEHAGNAIPRALGDMGLDREAIASHIAWDVGAIGLVTEMARLLDAPLVSQRYSRLVYDSNRPPSSAAAILDTSDGTVVPGNRDLTFGERQERVAAIYRPFENAVRDLLDERAGRSPVLVTVHSFTRVFGKERRAVDIGILHDADSRLADAMLARTPAWDGLDVRRNDPYGPADGVTHTLREHALPRGLASVMIEVCNDLLDGEAARNAMAARLADALREALADMADAPSAFAAGGGS